MAYLTYGENQVDQAELMNSLASGVEPYLNSTKWGQKKKYREKWLNAYQDIMNRGLVGASNENGMWKINHNGEAIDLDSKSNIDREMYQDAAYFIQSKMDSLQKKKEEEEKKETTNLPVYDNDQFTTGLNTQISNSLFGGRKFSTEEDWNILDERDENGIRGTNVRANKLADMLQNYSDSLEEGKYSFEGSPFKNLSDLKGRISTAIQSLRDGTWDQNDVDSLNSIGLNWKNYFYNGENDIAGQDAEGNQYTYAQLAERNRLAQEQKDKEEAAKLLKEQNANRGVLNKLGGIHAVEAASQAEDYRNWLADTYKVGQKGFDNINNRIQSLLERGYTQGLNNADKKELGNLLYYVRSNNPNYQGLGNGQKTNLSDQDWKELQTHKNLSSQNRNDYVRLPWQTDGRYIYADNQGNIYYMKPSNKQKIEGPKFVRSQAYNNYKNNFLKGNFQVNEEKPVLQQDKDILISDVVSMLGDVVSLGGGYAGAAGGITTLLSDLYGDIRRGRDTWGIIKNLGKNIAWGAAGIIPGAKLRKLARSAARIYAGIQSTGILLNDDVQQSWKNLIDGKNITAHDFENFKWTLHAITGGTNAVRGHLTERNVSKQIETNNKPTIETKNGNKPITQKEVNKINKIGGRKGQKAAEEAFKKATGEEAKEGTFSFQEEPRVWYNPARYSQRLRNWIGNDEQLVLPKSTQTINQQAVNRLLEIDKAKPIFAPFSKKFWTTSELRKSGNPFNKRFWNEGGPNRGGLTFVLAPYRTAAAQQPVTEELKKELLGLPYKPNIITQELIPKDRRLPPPGQSTKSGRFKQGGQINNLDITIRNFIYNQ